MRMVDTYIKEVERGLRESEEALAHHKDRVVRLKQRRKDMLERVKQAKANPVLREITRQLRPSLLVPHESGIYVQLPNVKGNKIAGVKRFLTEKGLEIHNVLTGHDNKFQYEYKSQDGIHYFITYREAK